MDSKKGSVFPEIKNISEADIRKIESDPTNFESLQFEYKQKFTGDGNELRCDIVQFANGTAEGFIFFGITDNPIKIVGIERDEVDGLKRVLNEILPRKIDPPLVPFPEYKVVPLINGKFVSIIKITPKKNGIYGIRQHEDSSNKNYYRYEFYKRLDGSKRRMNIEEVVALIESKGGVSKKDLFVKVQTGILPNVRKGMQIMIEAVNRGTRPITVSSYGIEFIGKKYIAMIMPDSQNNLGICSLLPMKLGDSDKCFACYPKSDLEADMKKYRWEYPLKIRAYFQTHEDV